MLSQRIAAVPLEEARRRREEVADLGRRLLPGPPDPRPRSRHPAGAGSPRRSRRPRRSRPAAEPPRVQQRRLPVAARPVGREAPGTEAGLAWSPAEMVEAIRLLGKRPLEDLDDRRVLSVVLACFALDRQRPDPFAAPVGRPDRSRGAALSRVVARARARRVDALHSGGRARCCWRSSTTPTRSSDRWSGTTASGRRPAPRYRRISCRSTRAARARASGDIRSGRPGRSSASPIGSARRGAKGSRWLRTLRPRPPGRRRRGESGTVGETPPDQPGASRPASSTPSGDVARRESGADHEVHRASAPSTSRGPRPKASRSPARDRARKTRRALGRSIRLVGSLAMTLLVVAAAGPTDGSPPPDRPEASDPLASRTPATATPRRASGRRVSPSRIGSPAPPPRACSPEIRQNEPILRPVGPVLPVVPPCGVRPEHGSRGPPGPRGDPSSIERRSSGPPIAGALRPRAPSAETIRPGGAAPSLRQFASPADSSASISSNLPGCVPNSFGLI